MPALQRKLLIAAIPLVAAFVAVVPRRSQGQSQPPIQLLVDATQAPQKILHAKLEIPVRPGPLTLYYPEWIPGEHMPDGPLTNLAGLEFTANGQKISWRRDLVDMFAFHLDIPANTSTLDVALDFLLSAPLSGYTAGASATAYLDTISWNQLILYPLNPPPAQLIFKPSVRLPTGWQFASALAGAQQTGDTVAFALVPMDKLVDSPLIAGKYFRKVDITPSETPDVEIDIAADSQNALNMPSDMEKHFRKLIAEAHVEFGAAHYDDYHFLLSLSDSVAHFGVEHRASSDDRDSERSLTDEAERIDFAGLLPHEYVHSWNGKFRRPIGLATQNYQEPMKDDLLWVYEGLTQYLGEVLTARSGLRSTDLAQELVAQVAAQADFRAGRQWRPLQDTADGEPAFGDSIQEWINWRRGTDYYEEGELLWLDIDGTLRRLTNDKESVDTFAKGFFIGPAGDPPIETYTFDNIVSALNSLAPYDWARFLRDRLDETPPPTADESVENSGWKLVYTDQKNRIDANSDWLTRWLTYTYSVGILVSTDGYVGDVVHGSPAYKAGLGPGMRITSVNGKSFSDDNLRDAIRAAQNSPAPITVSAMNGHQAQDYAIDYHGGLRFPHIERDGSRPDYLSEILAPRAK
ncbi:MAG TPA: PDZ domain-containing protein [Candidatus Acidoferrales bacterium]